MATTCINIKKVSVTDLRGSLKDRMSEVKENKVLLVKNRRQDAKYIVDKVFLDEMIKERASMLATLEILADVKLTNRLLKLARTDLSKARLYTMDEVFG
jgi:hypothetical protein